MNEVSERPLPERWRVLLHRQEALEEAGYPLLVAMRLAEQPEIDLHEACELLERGATTEQAIRILL